MVWQAYQVSYLQLKKRTRAHTLKHRSRLKRKMSTEHIRTMNIRVNVFLHLAHLHAKLLDVTAIARTSYFSIIGKVVWMSKFTRFRKPQMGNGQ